MKAAREHGAPDDAIAAAEEEFHAHLADIRKKNNGSGSGGNSGELLEDSELLAEDRELDSDNQGEANGMCLAVQQNFTPRSRYKVTK